MVLKIHRCALTASWLFSCSRAGTPEAPFDVCLIRAVVGVRCSLGRVCFRKVKDKRDYLLHRKSASWLYLARLAALR